MIPFAVAPGILVTVDPGKRRCGVAVWVDGVLAVAWLAAVPRRAGRSMASRVLAGVDQWGDAVWVIEDQQDYPGQGGKTRDLDALRAVVRALRARVPSSAVVRPSVWKGAVPKAVHHTRVRALLSATELARVESFDADTLDAVALGLWALGRSGRGGTRPGAD